MAPRGAGRDEEVAAEMAAPAPYVAMAASVPPWAYPQHSYESYYISRAFSKEFDGRLGQVACTAASAETRSQELEYRYGRLSQRLAATDSRVAHLERQVETLQSVVAELRHVRDEAGWWRTWYQRWRWTLNHLAWRSGIDVHTGDGQHRWLDV